MASGIEQRNIDSVMEAYRNYGMPNFSIWSSNRLCIKEECGNVDEAGEKLLSFLEQIQQSGTQAVYTLRVYPETVKNITSKTDYGGSTTFQLTAYIPGQANNNNPIIVQQPGNSGGNKGNNNQDSRLIYDRLDKLESENSRLRDQLHNEQIRNLRSEFESKISGLNKEPEKDTWDRVGDFVDRNKDFLKEMLGELKYIFKPTTDYIVKKEPGYMAGTQQQHDNVNQETNDSMTVQRTKEGALINPFINGEDQNKSAEEQAEITKAAISVMEPDLQDQMCDECLDIIEERIGKETLCRMLLAVACLSDKNMNRLLSNLD